jgi:hypothetical protein
VLTLDVLRLCDAYVLLERVGVRRSEHTGEAGPKERTLGGHIMVAGVV